MEVMNGTELVQTEVLVGQKSVTRSFGVSDDPMLMSMLSTGFYQKPLRTMIQEVMFNAWDAHRMGNCQDRPIDIYLNETTGLIIRDYGPGIDPGENDDNMHEIYCMYGGSTKRKMKNQTGGFGLGSKSPFAYTESFTVTSHYGGTKNMYLISRVSEANGGKPGMTCLVRVPTTETGLLVTIPLKKGDMLKAYEHIKDVLFLSGIKAMIHYEDEKDEFIDSDSLTVGQYLIDENHRQGRIWAVYGGVRYEIPMFEEYEDEYDFMKLISKGYDLFVGFAPDTLSPLPNREGLNMGEKSKETVKTVFEMCSERFNVLIEPMLNLFFEDYFKICKDHHKLQPEFTFIDLGKLGLSQNFQTIISARSMKDRLLKMRFDGVEEDLWNIMATLLTSNLGDIRRHIKMERWRTLIFKNFLKVYPEGKHIVFAAMKKPIKDVFNVHSHDASLTFVSEYLRHSFLLDQMKFIREMKKEFPADVSLHPTMRLMIRDDWIAPIWDRGFANTRKTKYGVRGGIDSKDPRLARSPKGLSTLNLWAPRNSDELSFTMMTKTVILAKTATALKDTVVPARIHTHSQMIQGLHYYYDGVSCAAPAYVVHERKGAYQKAKEILESMGFTVYEGAEPVKAKSRPKVKTLPTYSLICPQNAETWCSTNPNDQIPDPTHFFYVTQYTLKGYSSGERPDRELVYWFMKKNPKFVTVNHQRSADTLIKMGAIPFYDDIIKWYDTLSVNIDRMMNIIRAARIKEWTPFPEEMLRHPLIQLELGMEPVDEADEDFWYESRGVNLLMNTEFYPLKTLKRKLNIDLEQLWRQDKESSNIRHMTGVSKVFNAFTISSLWSDTDKAGKDRLVDSVITTLKLFS